jgi:hypothetical protein
MSDVTTLTYNQVADATDYIMALGRPVNTADIMQGHEIGVNLQEFFWDHLMHGGAWETENVFIDVLHKHPITGSPTLEQVRMGLNIWLGEVHGITGEGGAQTCFACSAEFYSWDELFMHKHDFHNGPEPRKPILDRLGGTTEEAIAVIEDTTSTMGLDLNNLPDGRYAAPDTSGKASNVYLMVTRTTRTKFRDRRYRTGKIVTGRETIPMGTIEVKLWSSDSKELIGEQHPGDLYRGSHEAELSLVLKMPEPFALLFGKLVGHCCICGKTLTDDASRAIGMGLECEKKTGYWTGGVPLKVPQCPICKDSDVVAHGRLVKFDGYREQSRYKCHFGHNWFVDKKGNELNSSQVRDDLR